MDATISFTVNGQLRTVTTDPDRPLLEVLREELHLTGTKYGCGEGQCRACTVLVNGKPTASCITTIGVIAKQNVLTIEGLAQGDQLQRLQTAFLEENAFQCGYCTAGMILGATALLNENLRLTDEDILARMQRHICRCGTYPRILKAIRKAATPAAKSSKP